jgi:hypothetical protein
VVHLVQVNMVGLQAPERAFALAPDRQRGQERLVGPVAHAAVELGGDHRLLPAAAAFREPPADDLLGDALTGLPAVDVGGVEEVKPGVMCRVHDRVAVFF